MPVLNCVLKCVHCSVSTEVMLQSFEGKPGGLNMGELVKLHAAHNLCRKCRATYNWLAAQGRSAEFHTQPVVEVLKPTGYREPERESVPTQL